MDKFYLAKFADLVQETSKSKLELVEVQFLRKPPTFGLMYLTTKTFHKRPDNINNNNNVNSISKQTSVTQTTQFVVDLTVMMINNDNVANFKHLKQIDLSDRKDAVHKTIVDFDTSKSILLDEEGDDQHIVSQTSHQQSINCIILTDDGLLFGVNLRSLPYLNKQTGDSAATSASSLVKLTSDSDSQNNHIKRRLSCGSFIQCKFQQSSNDLSIFIHLLAEKCYWLYELTPFSGNKLKLINEYSMSLNAAESYLRYTKVNTIKTNPQVVLIELNNSTLQVIQQSNLIFSHNLNEHFDLKSTAMSNLILSSDKLNNESILLSYAGTRILAQSLQITTNHQPPTSSNISDQSPSIAELDRDPDKLLPKDPSFELDMCWSIDLNEIDNLNANNPIEPDEGEEVATSNNPFRIENDKIKYGCLMPMWATNSQFSISEDSQRWPEYLIVTYRYHLLIYSFEQQAVLPFSVIYDSSFLKLTTLDDKLNITNSNEQQQQPLAYNEPKFVDVKTKPKLLYIFRLIGSHSTDIFFNNILLNNSNNNNHFIKCNFFPLLNLIISITSDGDMFAFKLNPLSTKLDLHKDNLFQQQYAKAIGGDSLLKDQMNRLQREIYSLKNNIEHLEEKSLSMVGKKGQENNHLSSLIQTELRRSEETDSLYHISMCLSNLIKVSQVIIMSTVNSYILKPVSTAICQNVHIENNVDPSVDRSELIAINSNNLLQQKSHDSIQSWAIIDLEKEDPAMSRVIKFNLPLFITDKQHGFIKVLYILDDCPQKRPVGSFYHPIIRSHLSSNSESTLLNSFNKLNTMFHIEQLQIKPLMSYQQISKDEFLFESVEKTLTKLTITGSYKRESMISWLAECFQGSIDLRQNEVRLRSQFNQLSIDYNVNDSNRQVLISSDDVMAVDMIKKHILKRATDESTKLNIVQTPANSTVVTSNQNHANESRLKLMSLIEATLPHVNESKEQLESVDIILDSLISEVSNINQGLPVDLNKYYRDDAVLENSLRRDLEKLIIEK